MAVYYKWIKGCAPGATLDSGQWSYISWGTSGENNINALPKLKIKKGKNDTDKNTDIDLGYFLTNAAKEPNISTLWNFEKGIKLSGGPTITYSNYNILLNTSTQINGFVDLNQVLSVGEEEVTIDGGLRVKGAENIDVTLGITGATTIDGTLGVARAATIGGTLEVAGKTTINNTLEVAGKTTITDALETTSSCTARYFNATSDKRAKENIKLATYSALDIINQLPVYNYNYKNNKETVVGILAQDLLKVQPKELNLVSNINATGKNNDYMSIKEDKFMFILLKAIQEQQEEIKYLKQEIENLKKDI